MKGKEGEGEGEEKLLYYPFISFFILTMVQNFDHSCDHGHITVMIVGCENEKNSVITKRVAIIIHDNNLFFYLKYIL